MSEFLIEHMYWRLTGNELPEKIKEQRSGRCGLSEKSGGPAKDLEGHSDGKDGVAKNLKHHSKRSVELAQILRTHSERSIKLAQNLREYSEKNTDFAKNLEEHSGRNEFTKHLEQQSKRNAQLANYLEKHLGRNDKLTKIFDGSSGWLQRLFAQELSILDQQKISVEKIELVGVSSQEELPVSSTLRRVLKRSHEMLTKSESSLDKPKRQRDRKSNVQDPAGFGG
ncbi:hypothetical protein BU17DRAFT_62618 [Hysterangium stoloniferum]|nr:hypothetical protein BU17DRAFT_62618 [Hysterangium stoloniferum]